MADDDPQQTLVVHENVNHSSNISDIETLSGLLPVKDMKNATTADILQQALSEADGYEHNVPFNQVNSEIVHDRIQHLTDHSYINTAISSNFISNSQIVNSQDIVSIDGPIQNANISNSNMYLQSLSKSDENDATSISVTSHINKNIFTDTNLNNETLDTLNCSASNKNDVLSNVVVVDRNSQICSENSSSVQAPFAEPKANDSSQYTLQPKETTSDTLNLTHLKIPTKLSTAPLGSLNNPIQIIQHGNSYHSTQTLTQAQLQQITHVLQRQHAKKGFQNGAKSILYDSSTNTRIVCRVVHPSELQKKNIDQETSTKTTTGQAACAGRGRGRPRKAGVKRPEDDDDKANSMLSKEEREEKKKHRPRTRSGRISKPPSYMVKDYKRIHHLDFNEEPYDDSDGGYSDYNVSDEENGKRLSKGSLPPGVTTAKKRSYSCSSCSKAYIGRGGLSRHYRLNPRHGSMPEGEDVSTQDENSNSSLASSILSSSGCNSQSNATLVSQHTKVNSEVPTSLLNQVTSDFVSSKRKAQLQESLKNYSDNEVIDAVLPKLASDVSLWDFFMTKCEQEKSNGPNIFTMLRQFEVFLIELRRMAQQSLCPATLEDKNEGKMIINISSKEIASALCLETGAYFVTEPPLLTEANNLSQECISTNATASMATTDNLISPPLKRKRIISSVENVSASLPDQILSDIAQEGDSLEMPLTTDSFVESTDLHEQESSLLGSALCNMDSHHINSKTLFDLNNGAINASTLVQLTSNSTTVTPSSLSSGCLSAVDTSETQRTHNFNSSSPIQVRKVQLYGSQQHLQQLLLRDESATSINNFNLIAENNLSLLPTHSQVDIKDSEPNQVSLCNSDIINTSSYSSLPLDTNMDIFSSFSSQGLQPKTLILDNNRTPSTIANVSILRTNNMQNQNFCDSHNVNMQKGYAHNITDCLPIENEGNQSMTNIVASDGMELCVQQMELNAADAEEKSNVFQEETHSEIATTTAKPTDGPVLKSIMMPDGQIIGLWSSSDSTDLKSFSEQSIQNYLPGNLIIVQNSDGSIQVPSEQEGVPLETLQALISMNPGLIGHVGAQNDAPV